MPSTLKTVCKGFILITWSVIVCEAGILPDLSQLRAFPLPQLPSLSLPSFPNPFNESKGWYLPDIGKIWTFWTDDVPKTASSFLTNLVPKPIKNLFNFDPAPKWVPDPDDFNEGEEDEENRETNEESKETNEESKETNEESKETNEQNYTDLSGQGSENRATRKFENNSSFKELYMNLKDIQDIKKEKGNLQGFGRSIVKSLANTVNNVVDTFNKSTGLDTNKNFFSGLLVDFKDKVKAIYPGTQWCGDGNTARSKKHLGFFQKTDSCCRAHDNCFDFIETDVTKYGLYNNGLFTRSNCACDREFHKCLKGSNDMVAIQIGTAYFTVLGPQCFEKEHPILYCRIQAGLTNRCLEYELDNSKEKIYQWFDNPEY